MKNRDIAIIIFLLLFPWGLFADTITITGQCKDSASLSAIPYTNITYTTATQTGELETDSLGYFQLSTHSDSSIIIIANQLGYTSKNIRITPANDTEITIFLPPSAEMLSEVVATAEVDNTSAKMQKITSDELQMSPQLMGETGVISSLSGKAGISSVNEGQAGLQVRGGNAGQNLVLLEGMPLYNPYHFAGVFAVINPEIVKHVNVYRGTMPAEYGGKIASTIDMKLQSVSDMNYSKQLQISPYAASAIVGMEKGKFTTLAAGHISYFEPALFLASQLTATNTIPLDINFGDALLQTNYKVNDNTTLSANAFYCGDALNLRQPILNNRFRWDNLSAALSFNKKFDNGTLQYMGGLTQFSFGLEVDSDEVIKGNFDTHIKDYYQKIDYHQLYLGNHILQTGLHYTYHSVLPQQFSFVNSSYTVENTTQIDAQTAAVYVNDRIALSSQINMEGGLRYSLFFSENNTRYPFFSPRFYFRYQLSPHQSLEAAAVRVAQFVHYVPTGSISLPSDIYFPSTKELPPETSTNISGGYFHKLDNKKWDFSTQLFYADRENIVQLDNIFLYTAQSSRLRDNLYVGTGISYGMEVEVNKKQGRWQGWFNYTLSKTTHRFDELNQGIPFPSKYDRTHDFNIVQNYRMSDKWKFSSRFTFATGNTTTMPEYRYFIQGEPVNHYGEVNGYRLPAYHRLDISLSYHKKRLRSMTECRFSISNVYNRANPFLVNTAIRGNVEDLDLTITPRTVTILPFMPSISYLIKF